MSGKRANGMGTEWERLILLDSHPYGGDDHDRDE